MDEEEPEEPGTPDPEVPSNPPGTFTVNGVTFTMIEVEGNDDISDYYIGETEVTQALWQAVMGSNPSNFSGNPQRPVENVSWNKCQEFITKLNELTGKTFRLPTDAEWLYAAKGGNKSQGYTYSG
ncbi:MAG: SUMF1/EgtB/PvdO family nonheme iron enzyme, partial [Bacteroidales bacterium]|nr:SUMF1/EgtB/PvdO family nonheme iron enzyme [Bacteroidales bacterium]